jgi:hypothetical protein
MSHANRPINSAGGLQGGSSSEIAESKGDATYSYQLDRQVFNEDGVYWAHRANSKARLGASERDYKEVSARNSIANLRDDVAELSIAEKMTEIHGTAGTKD